MKTNHYFLVLFCLFIAGCDVPAVTFEHPQPLDVKNELRFPGNLIGQYISILDSSLITITDHAITRGFNMKYVVSRKELDTMKHCILLKDTLFNKRTNEKICVVNINDSLYSPYHLQDTLFLISDKNILRKDRGYYFLNMQYHSGWEVQKIEYTKGKLCLCSIADLGEIRSLKAITENSDDSLFRFDPDKKQLHKFIKSKGFSKKEEFVKLK